MSDEQQQQPAPAGRNVNPKLVVAAIVGVILILFAVDQLLDMGRTAINVLGNCLATVVIARWEGEFPEKTASPAVVDALA